MQLKGTKNKCSRCKQWHQKVFVYYDNLNQREELMCLSCIAEIVAGRLPDWLLESLIYQTLGLLQDKLEKKKEEE